MISGCSKEKSREPEGQTTLDTDVSLQEEITEETTSGNEQAETITFWSNCEPKERLFLLDNIKSFENENPTINIETDHFRNEEELIDIFSAASLAGAGPDVILLNIGSMKKLAKENVLKDLSTEFDYGGFLPGLSELTFFDKKRYAIPFNSSDFLLLFYNKEIITQIPSNFEELVAFSKEYTNTSKNTYGFLLNAKQPEWVIPFTGGYMDWIYDYDTGTINLNNQSVQKTLSFLNELYNTEKIMPFDIEYEEINESFKTGETAMIINGSWAIEEYAQEGIDFGVAKIPKAIGAFTNPTPMITGLGFMVNINSTSQSFESTKKFIDFMLSKDIQKAWMLNTSSFPAVEGIEKEDLMSNEIYYNALLQAKICRGQIPEEDLRLIRDVIKLNLESVIAGNISVEDASSKMQEDIIKMKSGQLKIEDYPTSTTSGKSQD